MCARCNDEVFECSAIKALLDGQFGLIHREQLAFYGYARMARTRLVRLHEWTRLISGVFAVRRAKSEDEAWWQRLHAALLYAPRSVVSGRAAAMVYGLEGVRSAPIELTSTTRVRRKKGHVIHLARPSGTEGVPIRGLRVTSVRQTLVDLAAVVDEEKLAAAVDCAWRRGLVALEELQEFFVKHRCGGVRGIQRMENVLRDCELRGRPLGSYFELKMWRALRREGLPLPIPQAHFRDEEGNLYLDFAFFGYGIALETNGAQTHSSRDDMERDAARTARLVAAGWTVLPVTWKMFEKDRAGVLRKIREALELRSGFTTPMALEPGALGFAAT